MAELLFVGLGLGHGSIPLSALEALKGCDAVFLETYTAPIPQGEAERISTMISRKITPLGRTEVEDGGVIIGAAREGKAALLVPGDPMAATTHISLRLRAASEGISTRVFHAPSVFSAVPGILGLQHYKFGRTITIPFWREGYEPTSPYETLAANKLAGQHTLALLDIDAEGGRLMTSAQGIETLMGMERKVGGEILRSSALCCVVARAGHPDCVARAGDSRDMQRFDAGLPPHSLVFPGELHFMEAEALVAFAGAPKTLMKR